MTVADILGTVAIVEAGVIVVDLFVFVRLLRQRNEARAQHRDACSYASDLLVENDALRARDAQRDIKPGNLIRLLRGPEGRAS